MINKYFHWTFGVWTTLPSWWFSGFWGHQCGLYCIYWFIFLFDNYSGSAYLHLDKIRDQSHSTPLAWSPEDRTNPIWINPTTGFLFFWLAPQEFIPKREWSWNLGESNYISRRSWPPSRQAHPVDCYSIILFRLDLKMLHAACKRLQRTSCMLVICNLL